MNELSISAALEVPIDVKRMLKVNNPQMSCFIGRLDKT